MALVTKGSLRDQARQRADMVNSKFCTDSEIDGYINKAAKKLYNFLVEAYPEYFLADNPFTINLVAGTDAYALPADFFKAFGVDWVSGTTRLPLKPFMWSERARFGTSAQPQAMRYRLQRGKIRFRPPPASTGQIDLWYIPTLADMVSDSDTFDGINGFEEYIVLDAAITMLDKEESDSVKLTNDRDKIEADLRSIAANRDQAAPERISETSNDYDPDFAELWRRPF